MTNTATLVQTGPFSNGDGTKHARLYRVSPDLDGYDYVAISHIPEDDEGPEDTLAATADENGELYIILFQEEGPMTYDKALKRLGYVLVPAPARA